MGNPRKPMYSSAAGSIAGLHRAQADDMPR